MSSSRGGQRGPAGYGFPLHGAGENAEAAPSDPAAWSELGDVRFAASDFAEAVACYDRALAIQPRHAGALNNRGNALAASGRHHDALASYDAALAIDPNLASAHGNRGGTLRTLGRPGEALDSFARALSIDPAHANAWNNRANTLLDLGRCEEALDDYDRALAAKPSATILNNRGAALRKLGRVEDALASYDRAIGLEPGSAEAHNNRGDALCHLGRFDDAVASFRRALALAPRDADTFNNLANALTGMRRPADALVAYDIALRIAPGRAIVMCNRSRALIELKRAAEALVDAERALAIDPHGPEAHGARGNALMALERDDEALVCFDKLISLTPESAFAHNNRGILLARRGRIEEGNAALLTAIALAPGRGEFYYNLALSKFFEPGDPLLAAMERVASEIKPERVGDSIPLRFALAKAFADVGDVNRSFRHLSIGAAERLESHAYDECAVLENLARTRSAHTRDFVRRAGARGNPSELPVFVVGMPRSGSTLVEQVLASHGRMRGAGEINHFYTAMSKVGGAVGEAFERPEAAWRITGDQVAELGADYVRRVRATAPGADRVVNKTLGNFRLLGLVAAALPRARVVHVRRDPADTCFSCFATLFAEPLPFAHDLARLGRYYRAYETLMDHWRAALPEGMMLEVHYEDVVADLEGQARRIVEHCGLDWDPDCLEFQRNPRAVRTASLAQVRRPLYRSSVGRWRAYQAFLEPLLAELAKPRER